VHELAGRGEEGRARAGAVVGTADLIARLEVEFERVGAALRSFMNPTEPGEADDN
jgi:hypothetical protein